MTQPHLDPTVRHDMVFLFDGTDGNPNGDPDAGNRPRTDGVDVGSLALIFTVYAGIPGTSPGNTVMTECGDAPGIGLCARRAGTPDVA